MNKNINLQHLADSLYSKTAKSHFNEWIEYIVVGGLHGRAVKSAVSTPLDHLAAVSGVGSSPALATCETSQVLLTGVPSGFSRGSPVFAPPTDWPVSYELK